MNLSTKKAIVEVALAKLVNIDTVLFSHCTVFTTGWSPTIEWKQTLLYMPLAVSVNTRLHLQLVFMRRLPEWYKVKSCISITTIVQFSH